MLFDNRRTRAGDWRPPALACLSGEPVMDAHPGPIRRSKWRLVVRSGRFKEMIVRDLRSPKTMVLKAALFLALAALCMVALLLRAPELRTVVLALLLAWAAARSYYFLFYVLHAYVDPSFRYSGLGSLLRALQSRRGG